MMKFRTMKSALVQLLGDNAGGNFRVLGYQDQPYGASEVLDDLRLVTVFYQAGLFEKRSSSWTGPVDHQVTFPVEILVSKSAKIDLSVIDDPGATNEERAAALVAAKNAGSEADDSMDEVAELVYQILMDNEHVDAELEEYSIGDRWITEFEKDPPIQKGDLVVLTGAFKYTCRLSEDLQGVGDEAMAEGGAGYVGEPFDGATIEHQLNGRRDQTPGAEVEVEYVGDGADHVSAGEDFVVKE